MLVAFAFAYSGCAAFAVTMRRHAHDVLRRELPAVVRRGVRIAAATLLALSAMQAIDATGWPIGVIEWFGTLTAAALTCALLLTYVPRGTLVLALGLPVLAAVAGGLG